MKFLLVEIKLIIINYGFNIDFKSVEFLNSIKALILRKLEDKFVMTLKLKKFLMNYIRI
jgi:hypothetical protein